MTCRELKNRTKVPEHTVRVREVGGSNPLTPTQFCTALPEGGVSFSAQKRFSSELLGKGRAHG